MAFDQREEFFALNHRAENQRQGNQTNGILKVLMGVAVGSMWLWSGVDENTQDIYRGAFLVSPLIGLALVVWGARELRRGMKTQPLPAVESLFYVLGPQGIELRLWEPAASVPWATLVSVEPLPKQAPMLRLLHRPVGDKFNQQLLVNGEAATRDGSKLSDRLPLWQAAMAAGPST